MKFIFALLTKHNGNNDYMKKKHKVVEKLVYNNLLK